MFIRTDDNRLINTDYISDGGAGDPCKSFPDTVK